MSSEFKKGSPESPPQLAIQNASETDVGDILSIQSQRVVTPEMVTEKPTVEEDGFLVYPISPLELTSLLQDTEHYVVKIAKQGHKTLGYLISYDMRRWEVIHPDWFSRLNATQNDKTLLRNERVLYGRHIAVDTHAISQNIGRALLDSTLQGG